MNEITDLSTLAAGHGLLCPQNEASPPTPSLDHGGRAKEAMRQDTLPPSGFMSRSDGIYEAPDPDDADATERWLCSPLSVVARFRDRFGKGWGRLIDVTNLEGLTHRVAILDRSLETHLARERSRLIDHGLRVRDGADARQALTRLINGWNPPVTFTSTKRLGWTDDRCGSFLLRDGRVLGDDRVVFVGHAP